MKIKCDQDDENDDDDDDDEGGGGGDGGGDDGGGDDDAGGGGGNERANNLFCEATNPQVKHYRIKMTTPNLCQKQIPSIQGFKQ